ncbi:MAG TPA: TetR/AcrR family transcriptional regulator [Cyclobacteriaceae bacterium]
MVTADNDKLQQILEAARKRFAHFGLAKTTMTEIASDIGMSKASLYYYFPDKEHLFAAVIGREMASFIERMTAVVDAPGKASDKLKLYNTERLLSFQQLVNLGKFSTSNFDLLKPAFSSLQEDFFKRENNLIESVLTLGVKNKEFDIKDIPATSDMFVTVTKGLRMMIIKQRDSYFLNEDDYATLMRHQEVFTQVFLKGIAKANKSIL